ncbi:hypothetical protein [Spirillospora albida]|uniref:hypothetical protein n=1 Tax=Spirillospora albida TaxID=58123 RepID=UPI0004BF827E|nr:hypothetical protein [Spirillospora albida]
MRATRLAATGFAAGAMVLGMAAPALADPVTPGAFCGKKNIGETGKTVDGVLMRCTLKAGEEQPRWRKVAPGDTPTETPTPTPTPTAPQFKFGTDKVRLSTNRVVPGGSTTFTITCPSSVSITSNGYTRNPLPVAKIAENRWRATGTFRSKLPDPTTATVVCKGYGSVKLSTSPEKGDNGLKPRTPKIPTGPINTGDGSVYGQRDGSSALLPAAGGGALLLAGFGAFALRRKTAGKRS